jgi:hypothetical protein
MGLNEVVGKPPSAYMPTEGQKNQAAKQCSLIRKDARKRVRDSIKQGTGK